MNPISLITCAVGIIGCIVGVATFVVGSLTRAKEDGKLLEKVDYLIRSFDELKADTKDHNNSTDEILSEHTKDITDIKARLRNVEKELFHDRRD